MTAITPVWSESCCEPIMRAVLAMNFEESDQAMAADGTTKALVSPPPRQCSQNLCRPFRR